ncbi:coiled-coil domain-containing protein 80 [Triplophysa rosa]|uniref:Coiled-coil domain-containing protein 80 n=1 Tax=Triplophysa rosa TaxID=992332 RepID=A0A9W7WT02_TRIRA|nr:coiled-coil domain-containing protein 80 [Triplophysa rosa]KAI7807756.1 putative coiled-coil domain-containing protein 80 [Triplophysa rosa]
MKHLQVHIILLALSWTHASDLKSGTEEVNAQLQSNSFVKKHTNILQPNAKLSHFSSSGNTHILEKPQNGQNTGSSRTPARRVLKGNRPMPKKTLGLTDSTLAREPISARQTLQSVPSDVSNGTGSMNILAGFAGKNRVLVISAPNDSDGYYRLMMTLLKPEVYCEMAERHMQQIVMFHKKGERGGKVIRVSNQGSVVEESLDPSQVLRLMAFLKLEEGKFEMVLLRKTLQVEERYPYPVQLEAIYEVIDQAPVRRLEKARRKGFVQKCKAAGVEGQVVQSSCSNTGGLQNKVRPASQPTEVAHAQMPTTTITTTTKRASTTTLKTTTTKPPTTATSATTAFPSPPTAMTTNVPTTVRQKDPTHQRLPQNQQSTTTHPSTTSDFYTQHTENTFTASPTQANKQRPENKQAVVKKGWREKLSQHEREHDTHRPAATKPEKDLKTAQKGKTKADDADRKKKIGKSEKPPKKMPAGKRGPKVAKEKNVGLQSKKAGNETKVNEERAVLGKPADPKKSLETFLGYFEKRRRLIVITAPDEQNHMYSEQRDENLEQVCNMALRKISVITVFGPLKNSTMKIDHYQTEQDKPLRGQPDSDPINQELITEFRKKFRMTQNDFNMALTDFDMKVKQRYEVPIVMKAVFDYIDTLSTRIKEIEQQRNFGVMCNTEDKSRTLESFLSRFRWRRRLFIISSPSDEEWAFQQQLYTINSQACNLGLRHISVLKLVGRTLDDISGVLELYPINGSASVDHEELSASLVQDIRNYLQISQDYFSMLLVGKDGNVKSWYPSPVWSMSIIYDLIDSMQLRRQEMAIQLSLGMSCPDNDYGHHDGYHEGYHREYGY